MREGLGQSANEDVRCLMYDVGCYTKQIGDTIMEMNWTEILLGLFTLLSTCGWFVSGRKYR